MKHKAFDKTLRLKRLMIIPPLFVKLRKIRARDRQNPQMLSYADTSFTYIIYTKTAPFPSRKEYLTVL